MGRPRPSRSEAVAWSGVRVTAAAGGSCGGLQRRATLGAHHRPAGQFPFAGITRIRSLGVALKPLSLARIPYWVLDPAPPLTSQANFRKPCGTLGP